MVATRVKAAGWKRRSNRLCSALGLLGLLLALGSLAARADVVAHLRQQALPYLETVADADALPEGSIAALAEDRSGFLWIGTTQGLVRYDGYRFEQPTLDWSRSGALPAQRIRALLAASDGKLWVADDLQVLVLDPTSGRFSVQKLPAKFSTMGNQVGALSFAESANGEIYIGTTTGHVVGLSEHGERVLPVWAEQEAGTRARQGAVRALLVDRRGDLWVGGRGGLAVLPADGGPVRAVDPFATLLGAAADVYVYALLQSSSGRIWIGTQNHGAFVLEADGSNTRWIPVKDQDSAGLDYPWVSSMVEPEPGMLWLNTFGGGIQVVDEASLQVVGRLRHQANVAGGLADDAVSQSLIDRSGQVWIGTWGGGLQRHIPSAGAVSSLPSGGVLGIPSIGVTCALQRSADELWLGTAGAGIYTLKTGSAAQPLFAPTIEQDGPPRDGMARFMLRDRHDNIWLGTQQAGLQVMPAGSRQFIPVPDNYGRSDARVHAGLLLQQGQLLVMSVDGCFQVDLETHQAESLWMRDGSPIELAVTNAVQTAGGDLLLNTQLGLIVRVAGGSRFDWLSLPGRPQPGPVNALMSNQGGEVFVLSGSELWRYLPDSPPNQQWQRIELSGPIHSMADARLWAADLDGRLWSERGVIDLAARQYTSHAKGEGVDLGSTRFGSVNRLPGGQLLFAGKHGLALLDPARFRPWSYSPPVVLTGLWLNGRPTHVHAEARELRMDVGERSLAVEVAALDLSDPKRLEYVYRVRGYQDEWTQLGANNRVITLSNLWPGSYELEVLGSNRNSEWRSPARAVKVHVAAAFWQSSWFMLLMGLLVIGAAWGFYRWRVSVIGRRSEQLAELVEQRTEQLRRANQYLVETQQHLVVQERLAALGTLTAGVAHEINNPTNFADGAVQNLQDGLISLGRFLHQLAGEDADPRVLLAIDERIAQLNDMISTAREGHQRIKAIVRDLRQFTRLDEAEKKQVRISEPVVSTVNLIRTQFDRVQFELDLADDPEIECKPARLGQLILNLLVNACAAVVERHGATGGVVRIAVETDRTEVKVIVEDNGPGMSEELQARIFEPFFTTKKAGDGTGLGLSISLGIAREHHGDLVVDSVLGRGSRFVLSLPCAVSQAAPATP